jgi:hypothetical protein
LEIKASGYDEDGNHWTGRVDIPPAHSD